MDTPRPFRIDIDQPVIDGILTKVRAYTWHEKVEIGPDEDSWAYGTDWDYLKELCKYWTNGYDWREAEASLNRFPQFLATIDGLDIHFIHVKGSGRDPETIVLTHGWPGSVWELYDVIEPLAHPEKFGGEPDDGLNVVVPSLIGYGFSGKPRRPIGPAYIAKLWDRLMRETLGYNSYIAQGGDFGAFVSSYLGYNHPTHKGGGCKAVHLNLFVLLPGEPPMAEDELAWANGTTALLAREGAYSFIQGTKPQTLSFAMMDSPVGQAAWIIEKFHGWSDRRRGGGRDHIENAFTKDQLLTNVMIYLVTGSFQTASWLYRGYVEEGGREMVPGTRVDAPVGIAVYPKEFMPWPPRHYVEKGYNVVRWAELDHGGHFAAMEVPGIFVADIQSFIRQIGKSPH
jgi:microsomal epoxide hydrolase